MISKYFNISDSGSETTGGEQLNMEQMAGIFIVFAIGIGLGLICMLFEYLFAASADTFNDRLEGVGFFCSSMLGNNYNWTINK